MNSIHKEIKKINRKSSVDFFLCFLLLLLVLLYNSQGVLIPIESSIGSVFGVLISFISGIYLLKILPNRMEGILRFLLFFLLVNSFYFLLTADFEKDFNLIYQKVILNILPMYPFYYFVQRGILTRKWLIIFFLIIYPVFIIKFQQSYATTQLLTDKENIIDNTIYIFIGLLPFTLLFKRKLISFIFLISILFFSMSANKRSATIACIIAIVILLYHMMKNATPKRKILTFIFAFGLATATMYMGYLFYEQNPLLQERIALMMAGNSAERDDTFKVSIFNWIQSDSYLNYLFGFGYNSIPKFYSHVSHNDWLDMIVSFGLLGFLIYGTIFYKLIKMSFKKYWNPDKRAIFILFILLAFLLSMTSRWYWGVVSFMNVLILPYLLATKEKPLD